MKPVRSLFLIQLLRTLVLATALLPTAFADLTPTPTPTSPFTGHECQDLHYSTNIAALGYATAESYRDQNKPELAIDGDTESPFSGWMAVGDRGWWQVELPCLVPIYRVEVFTTPQNLSSMFPSFRISVSTTGAFAGEETIVATENQWPNQVMVGYDFEPIEARFIRLTALSDHHWSILQEFRAYPAMEPMPTPTVTFYDIHGEPTDVEQLLLEYINRARRDFVAEARRLLNSRIGYSGIIHDGYAPENFIAEFSTYYPQPPMSMNKSLLYAARIHAQDMAINRGKVSGHYGSDGSSPADRVYIRAGYDGQGGGENVGDAQFSAEYAHAGVIIDWLVPSRGHRNPIVNKDNVDCPIVEAGLALVEIPSLSIESSRRYSLVEEFGIPKVSQPRLTGVVFDDKNDNRFYDPGPLCQHSLGQPPMRN